MKLRSSLVILFVLLVSISVKTCSGQKIKAAFAMYEEENVREDLDCNSPNNLEFDSSLSWTLEENRTNIISKLSNTDILVFSGNSTLLQQDTRNYSNADIIVDWVSEGGYLIVEGKGNFFSTPLLKYESNGFWPIRNTSSISCHRDIGVVNHTIRTNTPFSSNGISYNTLYATETSGDINNTDCTIWHSHAHPSLPWLTTYKQGNGTVSIFSGMDILTWENETVEVKELWYAVIEEAVQFVIDTLPCEGIIVEARCRKDGTWVISDNWEISNDIIVAGKVEIGGNFSSLTGLSIVLNAKLNISQCAKLGGTLVVQLPSDTTKLQDGNSIDFLEYKCIEGNFSSVIVEGNDDECKEYSATLVEDPKEKKLVLLLNSKEKCEQQGIEIWLVPVVFTILIIIVIIVLIVILKIPRLRAKVFPFMLNEKKAAWVDTQDRNSNGISSTTSF